MTSSQKFLARWSRLKRAEAERQGAERDRPPATPARPAPGPAPTQAAKAAPAPDRGQPPRGSAGEPALPAIESLTATSDIRAFLQSGVPAELTKAALRRAWTTDPAIRDFVGLAENQWDFTDPAGIPGFGPLAPSDDVGGLLAQALGQPAAAQAEAPPTALATAPEPPQVPPQVPGIPETNDVFGDQRKAVEGQQKAILAAVQHPEPIAEPGRPPSRRSHGGAMPK